MLDDDIPPFPSNNKNQEILSARSRKSLFDDDPPFPQNNNKNEDFIPPMPHTDDDEEKEKLKRKLQKSDMTILGYEEKLKQANKTIAQLKEKEEEVRID